MISGVGARLDYSRDSCISIIILITVVKWYARVFTLNVTFNVNVTLNVRLNVTFNSMR